MDASLFLGVDGGGTGCRARLEDADGRVLGEGTGGPANIRLGLDVAWAAIGQAVDGALAQAGLGPDALHRCHAGMGLAGVTTVADAERVATNAPPTFASLQVAGDAFAACLGAHDGSDGAILIAGTGSAGFIIHDGQGQGIGGWGFEVSDLGSGAVLGREAVRAALLGHDGMGPQTAMTQAVLDRLGGDPPGVVAWVGTARPGDYGALVPLVLEHAMVGDEVATRLVREQADHLVMHITRLRQLGTTAICLMGGLGPVLRDWMPAWVGEVLVPAKGDAVTGALILARRGRRTG